jgi:DNA polymerase III subunit gamma/tau
VAEALYRKWRPHNFDDVVGQDHVSTTLKNQIATGRVGHAYLFVGSRGCGKTTSARILAAEVNIAGLDPKDAKRIGDAVADGRALDVIEIDAASHTGVDAMREIIEKVNFSPSELRYKVYIIDEVHMLSTAAFNALLKTLEEPPSHAIFILATTDPQKIPATVLSRCQRFTFKRVPVDKIVGRLQFICKEEKFEADEHALKLIARHATGALRDAVSLLDQLSSANSARITVNDVREALGATDGATVSALTEGIIAQSISAGFEAIQAAVDQGSDARQIARQMVEHLRALMQLKVNAGAGDAASVEHGPQAERIGMGQLAQAVKAFSTAINEMRGTTDAQLPLEMAYLDCVVAGTVPSAPVAVQTAPPPTIMPPARAETQPAARPVQQPQPAVAQPAVAQQVTGAPSTDGASAKLMAQWTEFAAAMRKESGTLSALLKQCKPLAMTGNIVSLRAENAFVRDALSNVDKMASAKRAVSHWLGQNVEIEVSVAQTQISDPNDDPVVKAAKRLGGQVRQR